MPLTDPKMVATAIELMRTTTLDKRAILCIDLLLFRRFVLEVQQYPAILPKALEQCGQRSRRLSTRKLSGRASLEESGSASQPEPCRRNSQRQSSTAGIG